MKFRDLSRARRRAFDKILATCPKHERDGWNKMMAEDEELLMECVRLLHEKGQPFDFDFLQKTFKVAGIILNQEPSE